MAECSYKVEVTDYVASLKKKYGVTNLRDLQKKLPGQGKQFKLDYLEVTSSDELKNSYRDLFIGKGKAFDNAQETFKKFVIGRNDIGTKISRLTDTSSEEIYEAMKPFRKYFNPNTVDEKNKLSADEVIESTIALKYILDSMDNEEALADVHNIDSKTISNKNIQGSTGLSRLYPTIGRAILASKGLVVSGDSERTAISAAVVGMAAVKTLADKTGIINIHQEGRWIAGSGVISAASKRSAKDPIKVGPTVTLNEEFNNAVNPSALSEKASSMLSVLKQASRLIEPQTEALPVREASAYEASIQDLQSMDKELKDTVSTINSFKFKINPNVKSMLDVLKKDFENAKKKSPKTPVSFKKYLEGKFKGMSPSTIKAIFGIDLNKDADGALFRDSNLGVELSQTSPMEGLMENYDNLVDDNPMFFNYFVAVNSRLNVFETVLNFQSDKKFARQIMVADKPTKYSATTIDKSYDGMTEKEVLIRRVAVEFKIPVSFITDPESNIDLTRLVNEFKKFDKATPDGVINLLKGIANISDGKKKELDALVGMSPWKIIKLISAIKDIRSNEGDIESTYMAEVDATASGLLIMLLQNAGNTQVQEMLKRLGFKGAEEAIENELRDAYAIAVNELENRITAFNSDEDVNEVSISITTGLSETSRLLSTLAPLGLDIRELIKMPIMTFIYGQSPENNQIQFAKDLFELVAKLKDKDQMIKVLEIYEMSSSDIAALTDKETSIEDLKVIRETFINKVSGTTGKFLVESILKEVYTTPLFAERNTDIETLYELIEGNNSLVSINSPYSVLNSEGKLNTAKNTDKIPLSKSKEMIIKEKVNDQTVDAVSKTRASNITSAKVIPIHTIDATVLSRTINRVKETLGRDFSDNEAIMLIHDAAITNSKLASLFSTIYEEELIKVNREYDIVEELINEYLSKGGSKDKIKDIITRNEENLKNKKEFLKPVKSEDNLKEEKEKIIPFSFRTDLSDSKLPQIKSNEISTKESAVNEKAETDVNMTTPFDAEFENQTPNVKVYSNRDQKDTTKGDKAPVKTTLDTINNKVERDNEIIEKTEEIQDSCEGK